MSEVSTQISNDIFLRSTPILQAKTAKIYKESLRQLLNIFGNVYYITGENKPVRVRCVTGLPERVIAKKFKDNASTLPLLAITEISTDKSDERNRYTPVLIHEKYWDDKKQRAVRLLSLPPRPINITYQLNLWTEYKEDMDQLRAAIYLMFNPHLEIITSENDIAKCYIEVEEDNSTSNVADQEDRILKKSILINLQTYISSPKFLFTSSGKIESFYLNAELVPSTESISNASTTDAQLQALLNKLEYLRSLVGTDRQNEINIIVGQIMALTDQIS